MSTARWFDQSGFMPHGHCYLWTPSILGMHVVSDILIGTAYLAIPVGLYELHRRRPDLDFNWLFVSFSLFIVACGITHWLSAWDIWHSEYWLEGGVKVLTAALSIPTAVLLWRALPRLVALPSHAALSRAHDDKELLLKEIHHRVKNNLAVISSLFYLESTYTSDESTRALLQQSQDRVRAMALVHETLYQSEGLGVVDLAEYAGALCQQLLATYATPDRPVELKTDMESLRMNIEIAVPCGLILNELITNALKHAFQDRGSGAIELIFRRTPGGGGVLRVRDNGGGVVAAQAASNSLGLRIVRLMARQIDAAFNLASTAGGAEASLTWTTLATAARG
jgi:two-component sensor histidine kinase